MRRHSTDAISLAFGLVFIGIAGWWLLARYVDVEIPNFGWFVAATLIGIGVLGVAGSFRRERGVAETPAEPDRPAEPAGLTERVGHTEAPVGEQTDELPVAEGHDDRPARGEA
jgi:hypothetical protein